MNDRSHEMTAAAPEPTRSSLSSGGRLLVLVTAFLGWMCAGIHMSITSVAMRPAVTGLLHETGALDRARFQTLAKQEKAAVEAPQRQLSSAEKRQLDEWKTLVAKWFAWCQCAFLFGAAAGGLCFGALGDRIGRSKGMALSILTYSAMAGAAYYARQPQELLVLWFLACMGVGGMWPTGVALVSEAWSSLSRPVAAGLIGTSANIGIFLMATAMTSTNPDLAVIPGHWRWVMLVAAAPLFLGIFSLIFVPESPRWLALKSAASRGLPSHTAHSEIFRPPLLGITLVGIALATIPLFGGWGSANWMVPWADEAGESASPPNPQLKAQVSQARSVTGIVGSLLGGWIASALGRRLTYLLTSVCALAVAQFTFWFVVPTDRHFLWCVSGLGFFSGIYFGWLPLCLPEMFPTRNRSTGAGVSFNFGRILTAVTVFATSTVMAYFAGDYAGLGRVTSLIFALGIVFIGLAPDTSRKQLQD